MAIFTALVGIFSSVSSFIGGLGALGSFLLKTAVGIGLNLLASSLAGKPKEASFSLNGELRGGGDLPRSFILGRYMTAGSLVWLNTWGKDGSTPNAWLTQVIALSDIPVKGLTSVIVDGKAVTYGEGTETEMGYSIPEYVKSGANLYIKFYDGTQTTADPVLVNDAASTERPYASTRVGRGVAYAVVHARATKNMFSGVPSLQFVLDGIRLYDPSRDSTVGGSGTQRYATPSTWGGDGDENPIVQLYNIFRGINYNGSWLYGMQALPAARLPIANWIAGINKARTAISASGGSQPTYRCSGEIEVDVPPLNAIETILTTCQGRVAEVGGRYTVFLGRPGTATASFTDATIISTEGQTFTPFMGIADSINGVAATYPSPGDAWQITSAPPLLRTDLENRDGGRRLLADIEMTFCPYPEQVQRLMKSALEEAQRFRRHTIVLPPEFWPYAVPGEVISWTSERNGYVNKLYRIDGATDSANLDVLVDITEVDPNDYDWDSDTEFQPPVTGDLGILRPPPQVIIGWSATATAIEDNNGELRRPAILLAWNNSPQTLLDVVGIRFEIQNAGTGRIEYRGVAPDPLAGSIIYSQGLLPNTDYLVRGAYLLSSDREVLESGWLPVRTPDIRLSTDDIYLPGLLEDVREFVGEVTEWIRDGTRQVILEQQRIARLVIDMDTGTFLDRQAIRQEISSQTGNTRAYALQQIEVATGPDSAFARAITELQAEIDNLANSSAFQALVTRVDNVEGTITSQALAITSLEASLAGKANVSALNSLEARVTETDGRVDSFASAITSLSAASSEGDVATANFRMQVGGTPGSGYSSRIGFEARVGGNGVWRAAGMFIDVPTSTSGKTRVAITADEFIVTDGTNNRNPFIFSGGVARLNVAHIGTVNAGIINSTNGKMTINLNNGTIEIFS